MGRIAAQGQPGDGMEAAGMLRGVARPAWIRGLSWLDASAQVVWRADEVELVTVAPARAAGPLGNLRLSEAWWRALNESLDNVAGSRTTRIATPDTELMTQDLVTGWIERVFPGRVDTTITDNEWVPAHADFHWSNVTAVDFWILDWEDFGLAPRGLDAATLWLGSLSAPALAERVYRERHADLTGRSGMVMALFGCAKNLIDSPLPRTVAEQFSGIASRLIASLE